ncbi:MAG: C25 family cysteine peptidase, partial [candidate division WOR-3 bacterium]|nr:C25 family cysteine peptidase [candidate division WOR-3 bacterium]
MTKRVVTAMAVLLAVGLTFANWLSVGGSAGSAKVTILDQTTRGTTFEVTVPGVEVTPTVADGREFSMVNLPGEVMATLEQGKPQVPKVSVLLAIPNGAQVSCRVVARETKTLKVANVYPLQPPLLDNQQPGPLVQDAGFYSQDVSYPATDLSPVGTGVWRDLATCNLQVYPVKVNPARGEVEVATRIRVRVDYSGGTYPRTAASFMFPLYAQYVDNFAQLGVKPQTDYTAGVRYLVIGDTAWQTNSYLNDSLLGWVKQRGYDVRTIWKSAWTYAEVKDSINNEYLRVTPHVLQFVLLVGEYGEIPMYPYPNVGHSDYWYSDVEPYPAGDNFPELALARLSPTSGTELDNMVRKILKYQKDPPSTNNWLDKLTMIANSQEYPGKYSGCVRGIYFMPKPYWNPGTVDTVMGYYTGNATVTAAINDGRGLVAYRGHGDRKEWNMWGTQGSWYNSNVEALTNGELTPVVYNICCSSGDFAVDTCLSEKWMRKYPGGAVASLAATEASYTDPNHGICSTLVRASCDTWRITVPGVRDYVGPCFHLSEQMMYFDAYVAKYWPGSPYPDNIYMYAMLGDPSMPVWAGGMPVAASVTKPDSIPTGPYNLNVAVRAAGQPVAGALVCAWKDTEVYVSDRTGASGQVTLAVNAATTGPMKLTVSEGHARHSTPSVPHTPILPYEGTVNVGGSGSAARSVVDLDTGAVRLSVCAIGSIGYDEPQGTGNGFQVPKGGTSCLSFGSFEAGNSGSYLVDHFYGQPADSGTNHDWQAVESLTPYMTLALAEERWVGVMTDAGHSTPRGLWVQQNWYMLADDPYNDWAVVTYDLRNDGDSEIPDLYVGYHADFNVGSDPAANTANSDTVRRSMYMRQGSGEDPTAGITLLEPTSFANLTAVDNNTWVHPDSCLTDAQKYRLLSGDIVQRNSDRDYDWSVVVSAGPYALPVGGTERVAFAIIGSNSVANWKTASDSAQSWYDHSLLGVHEEAALDIATANRPLFLSPNPFRTGTYINYFSGTAGNLDLNLYDAAGRAVAASRLAIKAGAGKYFWQPKNLA